MTDHKQTQQSQKQSKQSQKQRLKKDLQPQPESLQQSPINIDQLAREKVEEIETALKQLTGFNLSAFRSWFSILKQIITAADLHRTNDDDKNKNRSEEANKQEASDSIYADYGDDNEQFNAHVDLSEQFATNSVKWTIRVQAFKIVHRLVQLLGNNIAISNKVSPVLLRYLPDLIRLSFVAATSPYDELKMQGFEMFKFLINKFAPIEEEEFPGHSIMEQYKTQVLSAVKPAFNFDAPPYITAIASQICSLWICQGMEKEFSDVKRTYQLMLLSIEKLEGQSFNQHSKLYTEGELEQERVDILAAWAQLYIATVEPELSSECYGQLLSRLTVSESNNLKTVVRTQIESLVDKWWEALKDYALLIMPSPKFIGTSHDNENVYTREVALRLFSPTWPKLVLALTIWLCKDSDHVALHQPDDSPILDNNLASCDNDSPKSQRRTASKMKYSKFLCGIIMKELSRCVLISSNNLSSETSRSNRHMPESTNLSLRSLSLLMTSSIFHDDSRIVREFYSILYCIFVAYGRDPTGRLIIRNTLDRLFKILMGRATVYSANTHYALAKLISSLMTTLKNIEIACREKSHIDLDHHKSHLALRLQNLFTIIKFVPETSLAEAPLLEALISVLQEMLKFDQETVSLSLAEQLKNLYPITTGAHRNHIISELLPELLRRIGDLIKAILSDKENDLDKRKLAQLEGFLSAARIAISNLSEISSRVEHINSLVGSIIDPIGGLIDESQMVKQRKELVDFCTNHINVLRKTFPCEFTNDLLNKEVVSKIELMTKKRQEIATETSDGSKSKKSSNVKSKPQARITLKADFSNFYAKT